jgi:hypothetical protein
MDPVTLLTQYLQQTSPELLVLLVPCALLTKGLVDVIRRYVLTNLQGNSVQTLVLGMSVLVTLAQAGPAGVYKDGVTGKESVGLSLVAAITWLVAMGVHNLMQDRNGRTVDGNSGVDGGSKGPGSPSGSSGPDPTGLPPAVPV